MAIENLQPLTYAINVIFFCLGTASFFLRLYCRAFLVKAWGWDDVAAIFLLV
ncbi:hypothetical protein B0J12DRAFT_665486 [Macrophomina phaseolina]|uniref:RTA-like protein n=1 Tax=Macrophomina phaseolina TaxID=35725 RepID=A0ABQ8G8F0_9PEZI|nr:hypothetical protein B0J12DRAFT_665486 [Macrophomina phaseolina]